MAAGEDAEGVEKGITGVLPEGWEKLETIKDLADKLVESTPDRSHGWFGAQSVLIRAPAGTGKVLPACLPLQRRTCHRLLCSATACSPYAAPLLFKFVMSAPNARRRGQCSSCSTTVLL